MAFVSRHASTLPPGASATSSLRLPNQHSNITQQQSSLLASRIALKRAELDNLRQLCEMSGTLALQMQALENKIGTLKDGAQAVACVLANWDNVLRAINMASSKAVGLNTQTGLTLDPANKNMHQTSSMPATLVRIPVSQQEKPSGE
ncbi:hypothetical protein BO70DRAFT_366934 [Aspergillus heteromorphus CBS 117.55]|uniref:DASH complex subunit DAD2 n=1 Tax=Aspergillus heteromorphus CBS 117.55 TaxID=1448321 RepID=A0A317UTC6_9EURO|nr:uncharacterized protein BO70DRAFT_366934 [Aspergillus heteromorphus CBS 117.55]PWY64711.1 hypothetical protein BO70DRAFT_366934 [Aspergillus heteromorphus CBS 117.55]